MSKQPAYNFGFVPPSIDKSMPPPSFKPPPSIGGTVQPSSSGTVFKPPPSIGGTPFKPPPSIGGTVQPSSSGTVFKPPHSIGGTPFKPPHSIGGTPFKLPTFNPIFKPTFKMSALKITPPQDLKEKLGNRKNLPSNPQFGVNAKGFDSNYTTFRVNWPNFKEGDREAALGVLQTAVGDGSCLYNSIAKDTGALSRYNDDPKHIPPIFRDMEFLSSDAGVNGLSIREFFDVDFNDVTSLKKLGGRLSKDNRRSYITTFKSIMERFLTRPYFVSSKTPLSVNVLDTNGFIDRKLPVQDDDYTDDDQVVYVPISENESKIRLFRSYEYFRRVFLTKFRDPKSFGFDKQSPKQLMTIYDAIINVFIGGTTDDLLEFLNKSCLKRDSLLGSNDSDQRFVKGKALDIARKDINNETTHVKLTRESTKPLREWTMDDIKWFTDCVRDVDEVVEQGAMENIPVITREIIDGYIRTNYEKYSKQWNAKYSIGDRDMYDIVMVYHYTHTERLSHDPEYVEYLNSSGMMEIYGSICEDLNSGGELLKRYEDMAKAFAHNDEKTKEIVLLSLYSSIREEMDLELPIKDSVRSKMKPYVPKEKQSIEDFTQKTIKGQSELFKFLDDHKDTRSLVIYFLDEAFSRNVKDNGTNHIKTIINLLQTSNHSAYNNVKKLRSAIKTMKNKIDDKIHLSTGETFDQWSYDRISTTDYINLTSEHDSTLRQRIYDGKYIDVDTGLPVTIERINEIFSSDYRKEVDLDGALFSPITKFIDDFNMATNDIYDSGVPFNTVYYQIGNGYMFTLARPDLQLYALKDTFKVRGRFGGPPECSIIGHTFNVSICICQVYENFLLIKEISHDYDTDYKGPRKRIFVDRIGSHFQSIGVLDTDDQGVKYAKCVFPQDHILYKESSMYNTRLEPKAAFDLYAKNVDYELIEIPSQENSLRINTDSSEGSIFSNVK